jgi:hypothetical protein
MANYVLKRTCGGKVASEPTIFGRRPLTTALGCIVKYWPAPFLLVLSGLASGCATSRPVESSHPYASELLAPCVTRAPLYLYAENERQSFWVHKQRMVSYQYSDEGRIERVYHPNHIVPAGTTIRGEGLSLESSMSMAAGIVINGTVELPSGVRLAVRDLVESVAIDLVEWQEEHGRMAVPSEKDYIRRVTARSAPWCAGVGADGGGGRDNASGSAALQPNYAFKRTAGRGYRVS